MKREEVEKTDRGKDDEREGEWRGFTREGGGEK